MKKKLLNFVTLLVAYTLLVPNVQAAESVSVTTEAELAACLGATNSCVLTNDITMNSSISVPDGATVTLDLSGHTIGLNENLGSRLTTGIILVRNGASLTVNDSVGGGKVTANDKAYGSIQVTENGFYDASKTATLVINGGEFDGYYYGVVGNGSRHNTNITINGGVITSGGTAIYNPQNGNLTINGGTITGDQTGIEMRAGTLVVNDGTITGNGTQTTFQSNGSGTTTTGAAVAITQHTTGLDLNVTVNGGNLNGHTPLHEVNAENSTPEELARVNISVKGGTFTPINGGVNAIASQSKTDFVEAGVFFGNVDEQLIADSATEEDVAFVARLIIHVNGQQIIKNLRRNMPLASNQDEVEAFNAYLEELIGNEYTVNGIYADEELTTEYDLSANVTSDVHIYLKTAELPKEDKTQNPKTSDINLYTVILSILLGTVGLGYTLKKWKFN